uniref:Aspartate dehydrogenase domain-containing protein n=1 Tax=Ascaris lumbricoides TaxID=6252 RepID=A0A0M3IQI0_ASCLU
MVFSLRCVMGGCPQQQISKYYIAHIRVIYRCVDLVIEVAHPSIINSFGVLILKHADLFIGSSTALADNVLYDALTHSATASNRRLFVPTGAFWGSRDIQKMANLGTLKGLTITMIKHPSSLRLEAPLKELNEKARISDSAVVLYDGPVRALCSLAPNSVNTMAGAAIAAHSLGFDLTRAKLISDPSLLRWHIVEIDVEGPDGFRTRTTRENPAKTGAVTDNSTYYSILASIQGR